MLTVTFIPPPVPGFIDYDFSFDKQTYSIVLIAIVNVLSAEIAFFCKGIHVNTREG